MFGAPPSDDTIEVTLLGPGYGESVLLHIGSGRWLIVDSCIDTSTGRPAALDYFHELGLDPREVVILVLASHWHDDHIRGLASVVESCPKAQLCFSSALQHEEFVAVVSRFNEGNRLAGGSGVNELYRTLFLLQNRTAKLAIADRRLCSLQAGELDHGLPIEVWALSPSDKEVDRFLVEIAASTPQIKETKYRVSSSSRNNLSVVLWVSVGDTHVLLGSDLEETPDDRTGWTAIVQSEGRPRHRASVFKIPHHGSTTGHSDDVWSNMVAEEAWAVLTPFVKGRVRLPGVADAARILDFTPNAYSTSVIRTKSKKRRDSAVERTLREMGKRLRPATPNTGLVRLRKKVGIDESDWTVETFRGACHLANF